MQANKLVAFRNIKRDNIDAICNPGEVYFYFTDNPVDCVVARMHRSAKGITLQLSGWRSGGDAIQCKCTHHSDVCGALEHIVNTINELP
ncbi:hypothetical protein OMDBNIEC_00053 [Salmonella phage STP-SP5]|nr:hypothetical protein OMDBNIEC_00053 [Salmonella phage STP-SP5]